MTARAWLRMQSPSLRNRIGRAWNAVYVPWRRFWFTPADPTSLAVMRILFGGMLLYTHIVWGLNLEGFFGRDGWQGETLVRTLQSDQFAWSFWWWVPPALHFTIHVLALVILALFMLGALTPVTSVLAYLITISYAARAPMANYGLDQINGLAALYLAIGPSGRRLSIDRLVQNYRAARAQLALGLDPVVPRVGPSARANLALRLIQVHLCVIYVFACLSKLQGESWWNGTAIWQAVANLEYQSRDVTWLAWYPWLVNLLTHATIVWEMTFWALVWKPLFRPFVLLAGTAIHLGIGAFMGMWTFGLSVVFAYVSFLPGDKISVLLDRASQLVGRVLSSIGVEPASSNRRARAIWCALGFEQHAPAGDAPLPEESPSAAAPAALTLSPSESEPAVAAVADIPPDGGPKGQSIPAMSQDHNGSAIGRRRALHARPSILLIEGRIKRQTEVQEYLLKHGFRCHVASELHQARSLLSVMDFDALLVTSSWSDDEELCLFHEGLVGGGPALPASVFLLGSVHRRTVGRLRQTPRHRVLAAGLSLRALRLTVLEVLGLPEDSMRRFRTSAPKSNIAPDAPTAIDPTEPDPTAEAGSTQSQSLDVQAASGGNGSLS
jgi:hypothetical protein